jgi:uncharacterized protein
MWRPDGAEGRCRCSRSGRRGVILLGGPIASDDEEDIALLAVEAPDEDAARAIFDADPWTVHGVFRVKDVRAWSLWLDGRSR